MKYVSTACVLALGCGSVRDVPRDGSADATQGDGATIDAPATPRCDPDKPFGAPVALAAINTAGQEHGATLSSDELTLIYSTNTELRIATRASTSSPFGAPSVLAGVDPAGLRFRPSLTGDGLALYLGYQLSGNFDLNLVVATRTSTTTSFGSHAAVGVLNSPQQDSAPFVVPDHSAIYFISDRTGTQQLYRAARTGSTFGGASLVTGTTLQTNARLDSPVVTPDELTLYFASERTGGLGATDIYVATRATAVTGFGAPVALTSLSTPFFDTPTWVSADNCVLYFSRTAAGTTPIHDLYVATKPL